MTRTATERVHRALEDIRAGKMVILVDDEDRENEGDLVMAAELCTAEAVNFMVRHARGLVCLTLTEEHVQQLDLPMMVDENRSSRSTAFTISIEARHGVSTGISAQDRAQTILVASAPDARPEHLVSPGHIFPLRARPGGVLQRTGHTEGSVDLARLAGLRSSGVICEIMNDDGSMARMPDLEVFATTHGLRILSIADLVQYRLEHEQLIEKRLEGELTLPSGQTWHAHLFGSVPSGREFLALTFGVLDESPTLVRMHSGSVLGDVLELGGADGTKLPMRAAMRRIEAEGKGVVVFISGPLDLHADLSTRLGIPVKRPRPETGDVLREYGLGAQVLRALGLRKVRLLTNRPRKIAGVEGYGLEVVDQLTVGENDQPLRH